VTISCRLDGRPPQPVRPWKSGRVHLAEGSNVVVLEQEIRSLELGSVQCNFFIFWSRHENRMTFHWDMAIYRFSKWRPFAILELFHYHTRPPTKSLLVAAAAVKFHVNQIHRSEDIAVLIFRIFGLKCLFRSPKLGFWGTLAPNCDYSSSRPPKGTSLRKSASFKLSTVKIRWGVWPVGELTESVMDTHTHTVTFILHWTDKNLAST